MKSRGRYHLYSSKGTGGAIVEMLLRQSGLPLDVEYFDYETHHRNKKLLKLNPLHQFPVLRLPNGELMTESLAIANYIDETAKMGLCPKVGSKDRARFLRWSVFLVGSIYPSFTYADVPSRWVPDKKSQPVMKKRIIAWRKKMWKHVEKAAVRGGPYFLGNRRSLIDYYIVTMTSWGPGRKWFEKSTPKLTAIAKRMEATEAYRSVADVIL